MIKIILYISAFILANFLVLWIGVYGLLLSSIFLIPFDFIMRCVFHEQWKGRELFLKLGLLILISSSVTYLINHNTINIAIASVCGFISAQIVAGIFYQAYLKQSYFIKVNGSDFLAIIFDSVVFQFIAFGELNLIVMGLQITLKIIGGLFWYWIFFKKYKIQNSFLKYDNK